MLTLWKESYPHSMSTFQFGGNRNHWSLQDTNTHTYTHTHTLWKLKPRPSTLKLVPSLGCLQSIASCLWPFLLCHLCCLLHGSSSVHPLYVDCAGGPGTLFFSIHPLSQVISMNHRLTFNMTYTPMTLNENVQPWGTFLGSIYMNRNLKLLMESQNEHFKADFF